MLNERDLSAAVGSTAYDADGDKIGTVEHFFADDRTGAPTWVAVSSGLFGTRHSVVPATDATFADGALRLPVRKDAVRGAPRPPDTARLDPGTEAELLRHYGLAPAPAAAPPPPAPGPRAGAPDDRSDGSGRSDLPPGALPTAAEESTARPAPAPVDDPPVAAPGGPAGTADGGMTRGEERLRVSTERVPIGRVRLVKYVVTEEVQVTVPIRREEVRLEEVPLGGADVPPGTGRSSPPGADPGLPEEIVLHAERPVVTVEVVPVERVRVRTVTVTDSEQVSERLQREQVVVDES